MTVQDEKFRGLISTPVSKYQSPVTVVCKKKSCGKGTPEKRFVIDFGQLNSININGHRVGQRNLIRQY